VRYAVLILAQLAVGSAAILARSGLSAGLAPLPLTAWRMTLACAILLPVLRLLRRGRDAATPVRPPVPRLVVAGALLAAHFWAWFASLEHVSVARSTLLVSTTPVWTALGAWALTRKPPSVRFWLGLAIALVGALFVTGAAGSLRTYGGRAALGDSLAIFGAMCIAAYFVATRDLQTSLGTWRVVAWTYTAAALALWGCIGGSPGGSRALPPAPQAWWAALGLAVLPQLAGHTMLNWSLKHVPTSTVATTTLLEPVLAGAFAWALFGEALSATQIAGAAVLLAGVGIVLGVSEGGRASSRGPGG
jgi:drug/metabolite transporter (DMT)-like permease